MRPLYLAPLSLAIALLLGACTPPASDKDAKAQSSNSEGSELQRAEELVKGSSQGAMKADSVFDGPDGLRGIVVSPVAEGGGKQIVWASKNLEVLLPTNALDKEGKSLNEKFLVDQKVYLSTAELGDQLKDKGFIVGKSGPLITVFMDPNCIYCNKLYKDLKKELDAGNVRARFIMVGFLKPSSVSRSVAILSAKDPAKALHQDEMNFDEANEEGGAAPLKEPKPEIEQQVRANTELMGRAGPVATPAILACHVGASTPTYTSGMPQDLSAFIKNLDKEASHPVCK